MSPTPTSSRKPRAGKRVQTKLFVLDTNVLMHDPTSLFRFEEHDIFLPMMTLEELDSNKKGMSEVARNARQASRFLDEIVSGSGNKIKSGIRSNAAAPTPPPGTCSCKPRPSADTCPPTCP